MNYFYLSMGRKWIIISLLIFNIFTFYSHKHAEASEDSCMQSINFRDTESFRKSLVATLWTMNSSVWNGYIDFQPNGKYWTHWGYGTWTVIKNGVILMKNDYDGFTFQVFFDSRNYIGMRSDYVDVSGKLICAKYQQELVIGDTYEENEIRKIYLEVYHREPDTKGFRYWLNQYRNGYYTIDQIRQAAYEEASNIEKTGQK